jgi:hypothetical protein
MSFKSIASKPRGLTASHKIIKALVKGRSILRRVTEISDGIVYFQPICAGAGWRHAKAREIVAHWRKTRGAASGQRITGEPSASARGQLPLPVPSG